MTLITSRASCDAKYSLIERKTTLKLSVITPVIGVIGGFVTTCLGRQTVGISIKERQCYWIDVYLTSSGGLNDIVNLLFHIQYFDTLLLKHSCVETLASISVGGGRLYHFYEAVFFRTKACNGSLM